VDIEQRLDEIKDMLSCLLGREQHKQWYSTAEVASVLHRAEYTVREWARQGRIVAKKKPSGRGKSGEWCVALEELTRLRNEGLLPVRRPDPAKVSIT